MSRIKSSHTAITTRHEAEAIAAEIAEAMNRQRLLSAEMDEEIANIRNSYQPRIVSAQQSIDGRLALLQDWAEANPSEFGDRKSLDMVHARIGWRTGQPKLKTLSGWTWERVLGLLCGPLAKYRREKTEVNKGGLLADRNDIGPEGLRKLGVRVVQDEDFFLEPKLADVEKRVEAPAA